MAGGLSSVTEEGEGLLAVKVEEKMGGFLACLNVKGEERTDARMRRGTKVLGRNEAGCNFKCWGQDPECVDAGDFCRKQ